MAEAVLLKHTPPIAWISLARPDKLNAINDTMLNGLLEAIAGLDRRRDIAVGIVHGLGRAFCAGGDIKAMEAMDSSAFATTISLYMRLAESIRSASKPMIAAVHGYAFAGGFELALLCDIRIAAEDTRFALPDAALGLSPTSGMTYLLPRIVGLGRALHLILTGEEIDANEALRIGLVTKVVPFDNLLTAAESYASRIASYPRIGLAHAKSELYEALDSNFQSALSRELQGELDCFADPEVKARFRDFLMRRSR